MFLLIPRSHTFTQALFSPLKALLPLSTWGSHSLRPSSNTINTLVSYLPSKTEWVPRNPGSPTLLHILPSMLLPRLYYNFLFAYVSPPLGDVLLQDRPRFSHYYTRVLSHSSSTCCLLTNRDMTHSMNWKCCHRHSKEEKMSLGWGDQDVLIKD